MEENNPNQKNQSPEASRPAQPVEPRLASQPVSDIRPPVQPNKNASEGQLPADVYVSRPGEDPLPEVEQVTSGEPGKTNIAPPIHRHRMLLWFLIILVVIGAAAGGYYYWRYRLNKNKTSQSSTVNVVSQSDQKLNSLSSDSDKQLSNLDNDMSSIDQSLNDKQGNLSE